MDLNKQDWSYIIEDNKRLEKEMTLPDERYRAVMWAKKFLTELATDRKKYPRIPKEVRQQAWSCLRHYPDEYHMQVAAEAVPQVFAERMEPLYRMVKQHELEHSNIEK